MESGTYADSQNPEGVPMSPFANHAPFMLAAAVCSFMLTDRVQAQTSESEGLITDEELALRQDISNSLVGTWVGTFRVRNPDTGDVSVFDYRLDYSWTRTDGFLLGEGGLLQDGEVQQWSHDVYSWDADTGQRYIAFNGFGVPITHEYTVEGLDVGEDTTEKWSFVRTHTGRVGRFGILQQRVTIQKDGNRYHAVTENRDPDTDEDFEFFYEMILERAPGER